MAINFKSVPSGVPVTDERVNSLSSSAQELAAAFGRKIDKLLSLIVEARMKLSAEADEMVNGVARESRATARTLAKQTLANRAAKIHRELVDSSAEERRTMLERLKQYAAEARALADVLNSPITLLMRIAQGDNRKTQLMLQLSEAGPTELEAAARSAIMNGDMVLASAVAVVVDRLPRDRRPFPLADFAARVVGPQYELVSTRLEAVMTAATNCETANREFQRNQANPVTSVASALRSKELQEAWGEDA
jgi:hypothetical protein